MASAPANLPQTTPEQEESLFPEYPKVVYRKNPLEAVICELRFPPILSIDLEVPARFQDLLRSTYPLLREITPLNFAPPEIAKLLTAANAIPSARTYEFSTEDNNWTVTLTREALSLTCRRYTRWNEFRQKLELPLTSLMKVYKTQFFLRIGLRYRDVISREKLGLTGTPWSQLLAQGVVGAIHSPMEQLIAGSWSQIVFKLQRDDTQIRLQHGLQPIQPTGESAYVFDADFFTQSRKEPNDALEVLNFFNKHSWSVFRCCIAEQLHRAMDPEPV